MNLISKKIFYTNIYRKKNSNFTLYFVLFSILGIALRIAVSKFGYNFDYIAWEENLNLFKNGESFYKHGKYNYSPVWIHVLYFLDSLSLPFDGIGSLYRIKIIIFLSLVDILIFFLLFKDYSLKIGLLFFLNPISIIITGLHNQFDNFAILAGFFAIILYQKYYKNNYGFVISLIFFGFSLCIKHVLFLFPIWLAIKEKNFLRKILIIVIPFFIFLVSFTPYLSSDFQFIEKYVFNYTSFNNGPFWGMFTSKIIDMYIERKLMFICALLVLGLFFQNRPIKESFYLYLISTVVFSSALTNQYFIIPLISIAIFWNSKYFIYCLLCCLLFLVDSSALNIDFLVDALNWNRISTKIAYYPIILFLLIGLIETVFGKKKVNNFIFNITKWFSEKIKSQFTFLK